MKQGVVITLCLFLGLNCAQNPVGHEPIADTVEYRKKEFDTYRIDLRRNNVEMFWKTPDGQLYGSLGNLKAELKKDGRKLLFATNGGMYSPEQNPVGLYVEKRELHELLDTGSGSGNFYLKPNGVFSVDTKRAYIQETFDYTGPSVYATQSGPMLLINGKLHPALREGSANKYVRSGVGLISPYELVFAISKEKCNFFDFAMLFKEHFNCRDALYLDGAISKMYCPELNRHEGGGAFGVIIGVVQD